MKYLSFLILCIIFIINACKNDNSENIKKIVVNPSETSEHKHSDLFRYNRIIELTGIDTIPLGRIDNVLIFKDCFLVVTEDIKAFNRKGIYLNSIGALGKGPGEYIRIGGVTRNNDEIIVLARNLQKLIHYSLDGKFIKENKIEEFGQALENLDNINIVYCGNENNKKGAKLLFYNEENHLISSALPQKKKESRYINFWDKNNFLVFEDSLRFLSSFDNNVYNIKIEDTPAISVRYQIDFGEYSIPNSYFNKQFQNVMEFSQDIKNTNYAYRVMGFHETKGLIIFAYWYGDTPLLAVYSKADNKTTTIKTLHDDTIFNGLPVDLIEEYLSYYFYENTMYFVLNSYTIHDKINELKEKLNKKQWEEYYESHKGLMNIFENSEITSNPIILEFSLKSILNHTNCQP